MSHAGQHAGVVRPGPPAVGGEPGPEAKRQKLEPVAPGAAAPVKSKPTKAITRDVCDSLLNDLYRAASRSQPFRSFCRVGYLSSMPIIRIAPKPATVSASSEPASEPVPSSAAYAPAAQSQQAPLRQASGEDPGTTASMSDVEQKVDRKGWLLKVPVDEENGPTLLELCVPSPFGRGEKTMYDETVRRCFEVSAERLTSSLNFSRKAEGGKLLAKVRPVFLPLTARSSD